MKKEIISALISKIIIFMTCVICAAHFIIGWSPINWVIISFLVLLITEDLQINIELIKLIAKDDTVRNNQKIVKIFKSTIWMLNITTLFWVFLIKKEKNNENNKTELSNNFNDQSKET